MLAKQLLSQLSYVPKLFKQATVLTATPLVNLTASRKSQAIYGGSFRQMSLRSIWLWWAWKDLNFRPHAYQARALTN